MIIPVFCEVCGSYNSYFILVFVLFLLRLFLLAASTKYKKIVVFYKIEDAEKCC